MAISVRVPRFQHTYDDNGNRTGGGNYTVAGTNRLAADGTFSYDYDAEGNRIARTRIAGDYAEDHLTEYEWDHRGRLVKVTMTDNAATPVVQKVVEYAYDSMDRLIGRTVDEPVGGSLETDETFVHDGMDLALAFDALDQLSERYLFGQAVDEILAVEDDAGDVLWGLPDHQRVAPMIFRNRLCHFTKHIRKIVGVAEQKEDCGCGCPMGEWSNIEVTTPRRRGAVGC